jgi:hypothetical protein
VARLTFQVYWPQVVGSRFVFQMWDIFKSLSRLTTTVIQHSPASIDVMLDSEYAVVS